MTDHPNPHFNRWCVVDIEPIVWGEGPNAVLMNHIYCSFRDEGDARVAVNYMNSMIHPDPKRPIRTKVQAIHYRYPYASET